LILRENIFIFIILVICFFSSLTVKSQSKIEIDVSIGYSNPLLEARGSSLELVSSQDQVLINGKRWLVSDNLGAKNGYSFQAFLKYNVLKKGYLKALFNIGYNALISVYQGPEDTYGVRVQSFSLGLGAEANPLGNKRFYPSIFGLLRLNFMGGETFYHAGLDFFKVTPRYGYSAGLNLNYAINKKIGLFMGGSYSYDNLWNKQADETKTNDAHVIVFRDKMSATNELTHDRRVAYSTFYLGMKFYLL
jgi:hypothetical protein